MNFEIEPDEIFLDSKNLPEFNTQQFEGRIEQTICKKNIHILGICFMCIVMVFTWKLSILQIQKGQAFFEKSQNNSLEKKPLFANRGIISDRNDVELAWNTESSTEDSFAHRAYTEDAGFAHLLGYVSYPSKDKSGRFWETEFIGRDGIEKQYNDRLKSKNGVILAETDVRGVVQSENMVTPPQNGENLKLTIDSRIQKKMYQSIQSIAETARFKGGSGIIMDIDTGEILTLTNYPEYNSSVISSGDDSQKIYDYLHDKRKVFLNRAVSGLYTPGSIVKPFVALGVLNEKVIDPNTKILSTGSISIANPYFPEKKSVFKDWKAHGWVDLRRAIAVSSDVYFYEVTGGFEGQKGIGILNVEKYSQMFGLDTKTGIDLPAENVGLIPNPEWKAKNFKGDAWRVGDTYNTSIGQYGFQVTPLQMVRATAALARDGIFVTPRVVSTNEAVPSNLPQASLDKDYYRIVKEGMRQTVTLGTATALNVPYIQVAAKTGTAQVGAGKNSMNSWVIGFFPYDKPKYAFTILMDGAPASNTFGASLVMADVFDWMSVNAREYFKP